MRRIESFGLDRLLGPCLGLLVGAGALHAQVPISGSVHDGSGGPLLSGVVYHASGVITVPAGTTLTVQPGAIVKFDANGMDVYGILDVDGTAAAPAVLTSIRDDAAGGDTNGDGPSVGLPGDWFTVWSRAGATIDAEHAAIRFGGRNGLPMIQGLGGAIGLRSSVLASALAAAVGLNQQPTTPSIVRCSFVDNGTYPVDGATVSLLTGLVDNTASGSGLGDTVRVTGATLAADATIAAENCIGGVVVLANHLTIPAGLSLTVLPGVIVKWTPGHYALAQGSLRLLGTGGRPAVMTSLADDQYGGDTNVDGPSSGAPGDWYGIQSEAGGAVEVSHAVLRFAGRNGLAPISGQGGTIVARDSLFADALVAGVALNGYPATLVRCAFERNGTYAVDGASIDTLPAFSDNTASGNGTGDFVHVVDTTPAGDVTLRRENGIGGVLVLAASGSVPPGMHVSLERGLVLKIRGGVSYIVEGSLDVRGTAFEPVVLTSFSDDEHGGDTNLDGPSSGLAGDWYGLQYGTGSAGGRIEHALVRFGGRSGVWSFDCRSPLVSARSLRVEHAGGGGIRALGHMGNAANWVAFDCAAGGIQLVGGSFDLVHATAAGNAGIGVQSVAPYAGSAVSTISWDNAGGNFAGFAPGDLLYSDGSATAAGTNGNLMLDPLFVDPAPAVGDLRLQASSPCVDAGDPVAALAVVKDHREHSRMLDPTLSGMLLPDMGAYERALWEMRSWGEPHAGSLLRLRVDGPAGSSLYFTGRLDASFLLQPYGFVTAGTTPLVILGTVPVGTTYRLRVPHAPQLIGVELGIQTWTWPAGSTKVGSITNLYRPLVLAPPVLGGPEIPVR